MKNLFTLPLVIVLKILSVTQACPAICICKWRNGKETVECTNKKLLNIPTEIDSSTQVLDLSGNSFQIIRKRTFLAADLINLQKLFLSRCQVKSVENEALDGLSNLVELDLSGNNLQSVPTEALLNCPSLMKLSLSRNPIRALEKLSFNHLSFLTTLDISDCDIFSIDRAAFSGLYSLEWLDLSRNKLSSFPEMNLFPNKLKGIQLQDNPWLCDCKIGQFNFWLKKDVVPVLLQPVCQSPVKFKGIKIKNLETEDIACLPQVNPTNFYFEVEEGKNLTLHCQISSVPPAKISWIFEEQVLQNNSEPVPGLRLMYFISEDRKESSLFIYNIESGYNGTFYCLAENAAGVAFANYTIMIYLKQNYPERIENEPKIHVMIELIPILLAVGIVLMSLLFLCVMMTLLRKCTRSKDNKRQKLHQDDILPPTEDNINRLPPKSILKKPNLTKGMFLTDIEDRTVSDDAPVFDKSNPDIINGIKSYPDGVFGNFGETSDDIDRQREKLQPSIATIMPHMDTINRSLTKPYLNPTLTGSSRPVSAPTFERFVEDSNVRYTADGYITNQSNMMTVKGLGTFRRPFTKQISFSEGSSPKSGSRNQVIQVQSLSMKVEDGKLCEDVQL